jgi:hypothetical protein
MHANKANYRPNRNWSVGPPVELTDQSCNFVVSGHPCPWRFGKLASLPDMAVAKSWSATEAYDLLEGVLRSDGGHDALYDAVLVCREYATDFEVPAMRRLGTAEERLRGQLNAELLLATKLVADSSADLIRTWPRLRRALLRCKMLGMTDLAAFRNAQEQAACLQMNPHSYVDASLLQHFQQLFDSMRTSPKRLVVERVIELQPGRARVDYLLRRISWARQCEGVSAVRVKSQRKNWSGSLGVSHDPVNAECNEFYLFCSASTKNFADYADGQLDLDTFGRGIYLAEYATHAEDLSAWMGSLGCRSEGVF